jgi:hypothetical protein
VREKPQIGIDVERTDAVPLIAYRSHAAVAVPSVQPLTRSLPTGGAAGSAACTPPTATTVLVDALADAAGATNVRSNPVVATVANADPRESLRWLRFTDRSC